MLPSVSNLPRFGALIIEETGRISNTNMPLYDYHLTSNTSQYGLDEIVLHKMNAESPILLDTSNEIAKLSRRIKPGINRRQKESIKNRLFEILRDEYEGWRMMDSELKRKFDKGIKKTGLLLDDTLMPFRTANKADQTGTLTFTKPVG